MKRTAFLLLLSLGIATPFVVGCDQLGGSKSSEKKDKDDDSSSKKKKKKKTEESDESEEEETSAKPKTTASAAPTATESAPPPPPPETAAPEQPTATGTTPPPPPPPSAPTLPGHTALPSTDEWTAAPEVTVLGSSALDCESKSVREWVRISCKDTNASRGKPTGVTVSKGGGKGDTFVLVAGNVASLVYPFSEGQDLAATFNWERESRGFRAQWPQGAPKPNAYGQFVETKTNEECKSDANCSSGKRCCAGATVSCSATCSAPVCFTDTECVQKLPATAGNVVVCKTDSRHPSVKTCQQQPRATPSASTTTTAPPKPSASTTSTGKIRLPNPKKK